MNMTGSSGMEARKLNIIEYLAKLQNEAILIQIENLIAPQTDFWEDLSDDEKTLIKKGMEQHDEGKRISFDDFVKKLRAERE